MRLPIHLQREIARLHFYAPQSSRIIAQMLGLSSNTVAKMRKRLAASGKPWGELQGLDDDQWQQALGTTDRTIAQRKTAPDWTLIHEEMQRPHATREALWREWKEAHPDGIMYSQFTHGYRRWLKTQHLVMRQLHRPGEKLFVDFAGDMIEVKDPAGGAPRFAALFVGVLGYSNYTYLQAVWTQSIADWIDCHCRAFEFFGGAPEWVVCDNLKAAVIRREQERIVINPTYRDCLRYYDTASQPTGVRKPKHKAKVEAGVLIAQRWVLFTLRKRAFFTLEELNAAIRPLQDKLNNRAFQTLDGCRRTRFEKAEKPRLKALPSRRYELALWRYQVRIGPDYHFEHAGCFYSVPYRLRGELVDLKVTAQSLEVLHHNKRIVTHPLLSTRGAKQTLDDHRPLLHQRVLDGEPSSLMAWARSAGKHITAMFARHLLDRSDATNGLKTARKLRELAREYGEARFEEACAYALPLNITALRSLESILRQNADKQASPNSRSKQDSHAHHENVRGARYFVQEEK